MSINHTVQDFKSAGYARCIHTENLYPNDLKVGAVFKIKSIRDDTETKGIRVWTPSLVGQGHWWFYRKDFVPATKEEYEKAKLMEALE